ncbi:hypothetical protein KEK_20688 [Mycolicibacterium thermoresistibile ATCC 19527]|uniref:Uncharacterized protein n=1 Tax=Mycolicibacterium thermoresistibile (strain ATCC 19527 / DSM 44167 / CIP 105390 / JCM 6362 / NCTC 10409 / 316) TaxID=1078020 RepID=G7CM91_MYCT3|nr:hypothetical protein KEK_20688 [Mycolicibacterium thermoresistibile ATCC 19527]
MLAVNGRVPERLESLGRFPPFDDVDTAREVRRSLSGIDGDVSRNDDHAGTDPVRARNSSPNSRRCTG